MERNSSGVADNEEGRLSREVCCGRIPRCVTFFIDHFRVESIDVEVDTGQISEANVSSYSLTDVNIDVGYLWSEEQLHVQMLDDVT